MATDCVFCAIVAGDIPARVVYETESTVAFLDANPLARGHTLVIPKAHHERLNDVPDAEAADLFAALHRLVDAVESAVGTDASTVAFNNGETAGQEVLHVHGHIVPRFDGDGAGAIHSMFDPPRLGDDEQDEIAAAIEEVTSE